MTTYEKATLLEGVTVLDLTMFVAGPFATATLADLGASVIKIEPPTGDPTRHNRIGPVIGDAGAQFHTYNRGKKSLVVDLKSEAGRDLIDALVAKADAVVDNFRPGVTERLGLHHARLSTINPRIVSVSISAFGSVGTMAKQAGYDLIVQALSGTMSLTGHRATGPAHVPCHFADTSAGLYAALACVSAILEARRTGTGRALEVAMLDAQMAFLGDEITFEATGEWEGTPHEAGHPALAPYAAYRTSDGSIAVAAVGVEKFWQGFIAALGRQDLADDPRFADNAARCRNRETLEAEIRPVLESRSTADWLAVLEAHDVPAGPVQTLAQAMASPAVVERDCLARLSAGGDSEAVVPRSPVRLAGEGPFRIASPAPALGEHGGQVLAELLGYAPDRIAQLRASAVIGPKSNIEERDDG